MTHPRFLAALLGLLAVAAPAAAQHDTLFVVRPASGAAGVDTTLFEEAGWTYQLAPLSVGVERLRLSETDAAVEKTALHDALRRGGLRLVRRGVPLGGDFVLDGFAGADVAVVVDGERYPSSCPNRMDPPASRVNPLEVADVRVDRSTATVQGGLGGSVSFTRARPSEAGRLRFGLTQTGADGMNTDAALSAERAGHRATARLVRAQSYSDGAGRSFGARYGYADADIAYTLAEASAQGERGDWRYGASLALTRDLPFPFLMMDERDNRMASAHLGWRGHKLYVNRTRHLMDNGLRTASERMPMETDATNLTIGLIGDGHDGATTYEAYVRRWDAWNTMTMPPMGDGMAMPMQQHIVPDVRLAAVALAHEVEVGRLAFGAKLGLTRTAVGDAERLAFFRVLYPNAVAVRWAIPFGLSAGYAAPLGRNATAGLTAEVASEAPAPERLFVGVRRAMGTPSWSANPTLAQPVKAAVRSALTTRRLRLNAFAAYVHDAVTLVPSSLGMDRFVTYANAEALLVGFDARAEWAHLALDASTTWGHNLDRDEPLAEMLPLTVGATATSPRWLGLTASVSAEAATTQNRVASAVGETASPAWLRFDAGLTYEVGGVTLALEAVNLTDALYYQHLAYRRDPFSAGLPVYEPGRLLRLRLHLVR
ncbi:MAG: hypothetical protein ABJF88_10150 [Rhodothermales bacterium]